MRSPIRISLAVILAGLALVVAGLLVGDSPPPSVDATASGAHTPEMFPKPDEAPPVVEGAPGSREQLVLLGGMVLALGTIGLIATSSSAAARRARHSNVMVKSAG